ncbi:hypothetical protein HYN59_10780 [Flavobacterium album]|uniref:Right handed beta helix domain-containing protein n=1 Tax=Flavobacterium album TaxID=2175091 RepID=A0A2S1QYV4_9FLAO|nr:hypothetical protein [Flavobacterium album]AWH85565.1 hypothetical protein HYN59_10780 [Flavobacterium album]
MRRILLLLFIGFAISLTSCRNDFEFERSTGSLEFSKDTVYLDTVFTNIGSSTYTLKVYNRSNKDIKIPSIRLGEGEASKYRLMVDGMPGKVFNDVELLAKDSMFVFIETTIDYNEYANNTTTFLYNDKIFFDTGANEQKVELVTLVQDAIFIKPDRPLPTDAKEVLTINGMESDILGHKLQTPEELHWTNAKPYVVYGYAQVPNGSTLNIDAGARVHFHADSGIIVDNNGTLKINGLPSTDSELHENEVIFQGDRLEPEFEDAPGQWGAVLVMSGNANTIRHLTLKNAAVGILVQHVDPEEASIVKLDITDSQIYNCSNIGLLGRRAVINGDNLVMNNAGESSLACTFGGTYRFRHCTFANYSNNYNQRPVVVTDFLRTETTEYLSAVDARFDNCILYGSSNYGIYFEKHSGDDVTFKTVLNHCLIKFSDFSNQYTNNAFYKFDASTEADPVFYTQCIRANNSSEHNPKFFDPNKNDLRITKDEASPSGAENAADGAIAAQIPFDIANQSRLIPADIGAYESQVAPED